nr:mistochondrial succinate dehydrogenase subunit C [Neoseiulus barkeri]
MNILLRSGLYGRCLTKSALSSPYVPLRASSTFQPDSFFKKQKDLKRPLSPHLLIYKPQMTTVLSITHRITGLGLTAGVYGIAIAALLSKGQFPECIAAIQAAHVSQAIIIPAKLLSSGAFFYHFFNGIRHLLWDLGLGFKMKELYLTGKIVLALTAASTLYATFML